MSLELYVALRRKDNEGQIDEDGDKIIPHLIDLDYTSGRTEWNVEVCQRLNLDQDDFVVGEDNLTKLNQVLEYLYGEREKLEGDFKLAIEKLKKATLLSATAQNYDIAKEAGEEVDYLTESLVEDFWYDWYRLQGTIDVLYRAKSCYEELKRDYNNYDPDSKNLEVTIVCSY